MEIDAGNRELVAYARDRLREAILSNTLPAAASFSQVQLARDLGISRTPLREAVRLLEYEGLATVQFNKRVTVSALSAQDLDSLYSVRIMVEAVALHAKVPTMTDAFLQASRERLSSMDEAVQARDFQAWSTIHRDFHMQLSTGESARIDQQIKHCFDHAQRYRRLYLAESGVNWERAAQEHQALQAACEARDGARAAHLLAEHYASTANGVLAALAPSYVPHLMNAARVMAKGLVFAS